MAERNNAVAKIAEIAEGRSLPLIQWDILSMSHEALTISAIVTAINEAFSQGERGIWVLGNLFSLLDLTFPVKFGEPTASPQLSHAI
jgi:hypothetical protein